MAEGDYHEALRLLKAARDAETLTFDVRAKSPLVEYLRGLGRQDVFVFDLERAWESRELPFGPEQFLDYFHLRESAHRWLGEHLFDFLMEQEVIRQGIGRLADSEGEPAQYNGLPEGGSR
jgi:hypothetical protein